MKSIRKNFVWNSILKVSAIIFPLIIYPYVSRVIGAEGIGKVSFATSVIAYFSILAQLGIPTYGIRCCAQVADEKNELSKRVQEILCISLLTTAIAYVIFGGAVYLIPRFQEEKTLLLITSTEMLFNAIGVVWLFSGIENYSYITIRALIFKVISFALIISMVKEKKDYLIYGLILVIANVGSNVLNFVYSRKFVEYKPIYKLNLKRHMKPIFVFFTMSVATTIYTSLDTIMLGFMAGNVQVGFYTSATKIRSVLLGFVNALSTVLMPRASFYIQNNQKSEFKAISQKAFDFIWVFASALWIYFTLFSRECIYVLSGKEFEGAIPAMLWIMPTVLICGISNLTALQVLVPLGKEKNVLITQIIGALVDFVLNLILIPIYGATAAAAATTIAELIIVGLQLKIVNKAGVELIAGNTLKKVIIANFFSVMGSSMVKFVSVTAFFRLIISAFVYYGIYLIILLGMKETTVCEVFNEIFIKIRRKQK